jgi:hypothetical protein
VPPSVEVPAKSLAQAKLGASASYRQRRLLYHNRGDGTFDEIAAGLGPTLAEERVSRGMAVGDLDGDGRLDVVINELDGRAQVLQNAVPDPGNWLLVELRGDRGNRDAIGAVVTVTTGPTTQRRLVRSGTSYLSQDDLRQHFGLGAAKKVDTLEVLWPDGTTSSRSGVEVNRKVVVEKGR